MSCAMLVVGMLCLAHIDGAYQVSQTTNWQLSNAKVIAKYNQGPGWSAEFQFGSDIVQRLNPLKLDRHCDGEECIDYFIHCVGLYCDIELWEYPAQFARIEAESTEALELAFSSMALARMPEGHRFELADLTGRSDGYSAKCKWRRDPDGGRTFEPGCEQFNYAPANRTIDPGPYDPDGLQTND